MYDTKVQSHRITNASDNEWENFSEYMNVKTLSDVRNGCLTVEEKVKALFHTIENSIEQVLPVKKVKTLVMRFQKT